MFDVIFKIMQLVIANLLVNGKLTYKDIDMAYRSWQGNALKFNS